MLGLVGCKEGTRQIYRDGQAVQVTYITILPNYITQVKTSKRDGYNALQLTTGKKQVHKVAKPEAGIYKKANIESGLGLWEFRLNDDKEKLLTNWKVGSELTVNSFSDVKWVDVSATTKGKGFAGVIKRHHFSSQDASHGNSLSHRAPGSIGQRQSPRRVFKGKKMAGQLGNKRKTMKSLEVLEIYPKEQLLMIKGSIPGALGSLVHVKRAVRLRNQEAM